MTNPLGSFTYTYDSSSAQLTNVAYPNSQSVTYGYYSTTNSGRLESITNLASGGATLSAFNYAYDHTGAITQWVKQLSNSASTAVTEGIGYDADVEVQSVTQTFASGATSQTSSYTYDAAGNRTQENLTVGPSGSPQAGSFTHTFGTNNLNQLTNETPNPFAVNGSTSSPATVLVNGTSVTENANNSFSTTVTPGGGTSTPLTIQVNGSNGASHTQKNHILNTQPFLYDANGNITRDDKRIYTWDAANRLAAVTLLDLQPPTVADNISFQYDGYGRRVGITERHGNTILNSGANSWSYVWYGNRLCEQRNSTGTTVISRFYSQGEYIVSGSTKYFYTFDHLGSVREMVDSSGVSIQAQYDYDSFGRQTQIAGSQQASFGYTGFYIEDASKLDLTLYRVFDPEKGRWLSRDPLKEVVGLNLYSYVRNSTPNYFDEFGLCHGKVPTEAPKTPYYGNWLGPGNYINCHGDPLPPISPLDACAMHHDNCYKAGGISANDNLNNSNLSHDKKCARAKCDQGLCNCVKSLDPLSDIVSGEDADWANLTEIWACKKQPHDNPAPSDCCH